MATRGASGSAVGGGWRRLLLPAASALLLGVGYGLFARFVFQGGSRDDDLLAGTFVAMSLAFLFVVPFALGVLTAWLRPAGLRQPWLYWLLMPPATAALLMGAVLVLAWEGAICIVMAAPIYFTMAFLGGVAVGVVETLRASRRAPGAAVASCLAAPFLLAPLEARLPVPAAPREIETVVVIQADLDTVWRNVVRVPLIRREEQQDGFFQWIGIPRPLQATLSRDGVGALREASFEGGIRFRETITEWEPGRVLGFEIRVDGASISPEVLDRHVRVGGEYFDVLHGRFVLEPVAGGVRLRLASRHRLSTRFNAYAGLWTDAVMRDVQRKICRVIQQRCEKRQSGLTPAGRPGPPW